MYQKPVMSDLELPEASESFDKPSKIARSL